jgi:ABC-2 type transport system ATP-binding protein
MIRITALNRSFGDQPALQDVSLSIGSGVTGVLGPNGAGKSTLLRLLATVLTPDSGQIIVDGQALAGDLTPFRRQTGYLPQVLELPEQLSALDFLRSMAALKELTDLDQGAVLLERLGLAGLGNLPMGRLSAGQRRLVGLAQALLGRPRLILLDEFSQSLDVAARDALFGVLRDAALAGRTLVLSSNVPSDLEAVADHLVVLEAGRLLFSGPVQGLKSMARGRVFELHASASEPEPALPGLVVSRQQAGGESIVRLVGARPPAEGALPREPSLEDAYLLLLHADALPLS